MKFVQVPTAEGKAITISVERVVSISMGRWTRRNAVIDVPVIEIETGVGLRQIYVDLTMEELVALLSGEAP